MKKNQKKITPKRRVKKMIPKRKQKEILKAMVYVNPEVAKKYRGIFIRCVERK